MFRKTTKFLKFLKYSEEFQVFEATSDSNRVKCKLCHAVINVKYKGSTALKIHLNTEKHKRSTVLKTDEEIFYNEKTCRVCLTSTFGKEYEIILENLAEKFKKYGGIDVSLFVDITRYNGNSNKIFIYIKV